MKAIVACLAGLLALPAASFAQNNVWHPVQGAGGVDVAWRWRQELKDQFIAELKFQNRNPYKVDVSFRAYFVCNDGREVIDSGSTISVNPNGETGGQWAGLFWYPCPGERPRVGGYRDLRVRKSGT